MRYLSVGAVICLMSAAAGAQTPNPELMAPIQKFVETFNKGDVAGAAAAHAAGPDLVIVDEVPPYLWRGEQAFHAWSTDLDADAKKNGMTEPAVSIGPPVRADVTGDHAYVVVPATFTFTQKGTAMREAAQMTFVLKKGASGWLIQAWSWAGGKPTADAGKK